MAKLVASMLIAAVLPAIIYTMSIPSGIIYSHSPSDLISKYNFSQFCLTQVLKSKMLTLKMIKSLPQTRKMA